MGLFYFYLFTVESILNESGENLLGKYKAFLLLYIYFFVTQKLENLEKYLLFCC